LTLGAVLKDQHDIDTVSAQLADLLSTVISGG
jgi:hypothetical protein